MKFTKSQYSIEDLEQFRTTEGYIDLDQIDLVLEKESREKRGNTERFKNWIDFAGTKVLIKEENRLEGKRNYGIYSDLIIEELARQVGIPAAHYDVIKFKGKYGVLSHMVVDPEKEELETIYGLIGDTTVDPENPDITDYIEVEKKFKKSLKNFDMTDAEIRQVINDRRKQKILQYICGENDAHIENEAIVRYRTEDGRVSAKMSKMFDNETSFLLDLDEETLKTIKFNNDEDNQYKEQLENMLKMKKQGQTFQQMIEDSEVLKIIVYNLRNLGVSERKLAEILDGDASIREAAKPLRSKIAYLPEEDEMEDFPYDSVTDNTIAFMREIGDEEEEIADFLGEVYEKLDIETAIKNVEKKIKAPVPELVKDIVVPFMKMRIRTLNDILCYQEPCEEKQEVAKNLHNIFVSSRKPEVLTDRSIGKQYSKQIAEKSIEENISMKEGIGELEHLYQMIKQKENQKTSEKNAEDYTH